MCFTIFGWQLAPIRIRLNGANRMNGLHLPPLGPMFCTLLTLLFLFLLYSKRHSSVFLLLFLSRKLKRRFFDSHWLILLLLLTAYLVFSFKSKQTKRRLLAGVRASVSASVWGCRFRFAGPQLNSITRLSTKKPSNESKRMAFQWTAK